MHRVPPLLLVVAIGLALCSSLNPSAQGQQPPQAQWDYLEVDPWCTHEGTFKVRWQVSGESHWYRIYLLDLGEIGRTDSGEEGSATLPCTDMRDHYGNPLLENKYVELIFHASGSNSNDSAQRAVVLGLLAAAPPERIDNVALFAGWSSFAGTPVWVHDTYPSHRPRSRLATNQPWSFDVVAVGRFRRLSQDTWEYFLPYPPCLQPPFTCRRSHVESLAPDTLYEIELAWAWLPRDVHSRGLRDDPYSIQTDPPPFATLYLLWQPHNDLRAMQWSEARVIRTPPPPTLSVSASSDAIRVSWPTAEGLHWVSLTSPTWPGVIWADRHNSRPWDRVGGDLGAEAMTSTIAGLPGDTPFDITVSTSRYSSVTVPSELQILSRTTPAEPRPFHAPADPLGIRVSTHDRSIYASWVEHQGMLTDAQVVYTCPGVECIEPRYTQRVDRLNSVDSWMPPLLRRAQTTYRFGPLPEMTTWRLIVNRYPYYWNLNDLNDLPFVCMEWEIRIGVTNPELYYDHYAFSYDRDLPSPVQGPDQIAEPTFDGCLLAEPRGE